VLDEAQTQISSLAAAGIAFATFATFDDRWYEGKVRNGKRCRKKLHRAHRALGVSILLLADPAKSCPRYFAAQRALTLRVEDADLDAIAATTSTSRPWRHAVDPSRGWGS